MTKFVNAVQNQESRTENNMKARKSTSNALVDLFYKIGASRGKNIIPEFTAAMVADKTLAPRIALWARDVRGGAGERDIFRNILSHLENTNPELASRLMQKIPEVGRWDDLFVFKTRDLKSKAYTMLGDAIRNAQQAENILNQIDNLSEKECEALLKKFSDQNC